MESNDLAADILGFWRRAFRKGTREAAWVARAAELSATARRLGRLPRAGDPDVEPRTLSWVKNQRRAELHPAQTSALNLIPGWSWSPQDDVWDVHAAHFGQFVQRERRQPRIRATDVDERRLGTWAARQRRAAETGALPYARLVRWRELQASSPVNGEKDERLAD